MNNVTSHTPVEQLPYRGQISVGHYGGPVANRVEQCNDVAFGDVLNFAAAPKIEHRRRLALLRLDNEQLAGVIRVRFDAKNSGRLPP